LLEICLLKVNKDANHDIALFWVNQDWRDYPQKNYGKKVRGKVLVFF
jgi:hypothetical protein